ncbi:SA1788 family PVL leukocidin-associated protein [Staphylococcus felis]|uniref:SA1788 family PVL leukocidin-associated protein n=1 Tax=Staphylococcus felis TaxID=46127 RepID=UPI003F427782
MPYVTVNKVKYSYSEEQAKTAAENGITASTIYNRIRLGWTVKDAVSIPLKMSKEEYKVYVKMQKKQRLSMSMDRQRELEREERLKNIPQSVKPSEYFKNLCQFVGVKP